MQVKNRYPIADPLPRFIPFYVQSYDPNGTNRPPPVYRFSLPFQVKPNGMILCCELLEAEINWSPIFPNGAGLYTQDAGLIFRRLAFDATSDQIDGQQQQNAWGSSTSPEVCYNPYSKPSVMGVVDNCIGWAGPNTTQTIGNVGTTPTSVSVTPLKDLNVRYTFGCKGAYPVVPSAQLNIWSYMLVSNNAQFIGGYVPGFTVTAPYNQVFYDAIQAPVSPAVTSSRPNVTGRIWFRIVEITPMQHLLLCARYTNKENNPATIINKYNTTDVAGSTTGALDENVVSVNPNPTAALNPFFG